MTVSVLWRLLVVPWVGLQCVLMVFHYHTHLHFKDDLNSSFTGGGGGGGGWGLWGTVAANLHTSKLNFARV